MTTTQDRLGVEYRDPRQLKPHPHNARTHSRKQRRAMAASIRRFGFVNPVLIDEDDVIIAGHGRVMAAKELELATIPVIRIEHMNEDERRAYIIADNKLAEMAGWDRDILATELQHLLGIDVTLPEVVGFDIGEVDVLLTEAGERVDPDDESLPEVEAQAVSRPGDLWRLGDRHRVLCGDARDGTGMAALMDGSQADCAFIDPPYNVAISGHAGGKGAVRHREFAMAAGEMSPEAFIAFLRACGKALASVSRDGAVHFVCMDWRHMGELLEALGPVYARLLNVCVWRKSNAGMGSLYRSQHELVFVWRHGAAPHLNTVELGRHGRHRTNVWDYPSVNTFRADRRAQLAWHPTVKPVAMVADAIKDVTRRGDLVVDSFLGSGTTLIACERTGRRCRGMEIDPLYVDLALRRWSEATGIEPVLAATGQPFSTVARERHSAGA
jgi:DNA modification methylase